MLKIKTDAVRHSEIAPSDPYWKLRRGRSSAPAEGGRPRHTGLGRLRTDHHTPIKKPMKKIKKGVQKALEEIETNTQQPQYNP